MRLDKILEKKGQKATSPPKEYITEVEISMGNNLVKITSDRIRFAYWILTGRSSRRAVNLEKNDVIKYCKQIIKKLEVR